MASLHGSGPWWSTISAREDRPRSGIEPILGDRPARASRCGRPSSVSLILVPGGNPAFEHEGGPVRLFGAEIDRFRLCRSALRPVLCLACWAQEFGFAQFHRRASQRRWPAVALPLSSALAAGLPFRRLDGQCSALCRRCPGPAPPTGLPGTRFLRPTGSRSVICFSSFSSCRPTLARRWPA